MISLLGEGESELCQYCVSKYIYTSTYWEMVLQIPKQSYSLDPQFPNTLATIGFDWNPSSNHQTQHYFTAALWPNG